MLFNRFFLGTNLDYIIAIQNEHSSFLWQMIKMSPFYFTWHTLCCLHSAAPSQCFGVRCHAERIRPPGGLAAQRGHGLTWRVLQGKNYVGKKAKTITNASYQMQLVVTNVADPEPNKYGNSDPDPSVGFYQKLSKVKERHKYWCRKTFYLFFQSSVNFCFSFIKVLP